MESHLDHWDLVYQPPFPAEHVDQYRPGGYHPISIGQCVGVYRIWHKLGHGEHATVWLAEQLATKTWVALKIYKSSIDHSIPSSDVLDEFYTESPNGWHRVVALELIIPLQDMKPLAPSPHCQRIARVLAELVASYHSKGLTVNGEPASHIRCGRRSLGAQIPV